MSDYDDRYRRPPRRGPADPRDPRDARAGDHRGNDPRGNDPRGGSPHGAPRDPRDPEPRDQDPRVVYESDDYDSDGYASAHHRPSRRYDGPTQGPTSGPMPGPSHGSHTPAAGPRSDPRTGQDWAYDRRAYDSPTYDRAAYSQTDPSTRRPHHGERPFGQALGLTVLGTLVPGVGLIAAGRRRAGVAVLAVTVALLAFVAYFAIFRRRDLLHMAVEQSALTWLAPTLLLVGLAWVVLIVVSYRLLRPWRISPLARIGGSALVMVLSIVVLLPMAFSARLVTVQSDTIGAVFKDAPRSETRPKNVTAADPWGGRDRVNVLLLGGDGGADRVGVRTDSVMLASIDTRTGNAVLFSLPRNLEKVPFPPGSKLAKLYPGGIFDPGRRFRSTDEELEYMLTAMYENVPQQHPGVLKSDNPGADVDKMVVGQVLGLPVDYYLLINLKGFQTLVDALGGITVNVNERVAIGGDHQTGTPPHDWIQPGPNKHLDGYHALWFARGRWGADDYQRMHRQRCTMNAIIHQANPTKVLERYEAIANATKQIVRTDIPRSLLPAFVDLSMKVKDADVSSVIFDNKLIKPWDPDYPFIRKTVQKAVTKSDGSAKPGTKPSSTPSPSPTPTDTPNPSTGSGKNTTDDTTSSIAESCAYHPGKD